MRLMFLLVVAFFMFAPTAEAQRDRDCGRNGCPGAERQDRGPRNDRGYDRGRDYRDDRGYNRGRQEQSRGRRIEQAYRDELRYAPPRSRGNTWYRGDRFDRRDTRFVIVRDYRQYRLAPPRHGQHYYRDHRTGDVLLIASATGLIIWALTN